MPAKKSKKQRKHGRMKAWCLAYKNYQKRERNKAKKLHKHLKRFPADGVAISALSALPKQFVVDRSLIHVQD